MSEFRFSVSQLLKEPVGSTRRHELDDAELAVDRDVAMRPVRGTVRMVRTLHGVLSQVHATGDVAFECTRCLTSFEQPLELDFEEEFYQTVDVYSGMRLPAPDEADTFRIDETHRLDLEDAMREYALLGLPAAPRCRADCKGLCPECGKNLNEGDCDCERELVDERFAALAKLLRGSAEGTTSLPNRPEPPATS